MVCLRISGLRWRSINNDPNTAYIIPLESDEFRCTPEAKLRVYRTRNAGESWEPLTNGLPQENAFETVLRDGMSGDTSPSDLGSILARATVNSLAQTTEESRGARSWKDCQR